VFSMRCRTTSVVSDWISDVCSSDLDPFNNQKMVIRGGGGVYYQTVFTGLAFVPSVLQSGAISNLFVSADPRLTPISPTSPCGQEIGRASCRESAEESARGADVHRQH